MAFSPDRTYFVINATGGPHTGTLCDAASRCATGATGADLQLTWIDQSGDDTLWAMTTPSYGAIAGLTTPTAQRTPTSAP